MRQVAALFGRESFSNRFERFQGFSSLRLCRRCYVTQEGILDIWDQEHPRAIQFKLESRLAARETLNQSPKSPTVALLPSEKMALEGKRVGSMLVN